MKKLIVKSIAFILIILLAVAPISIYVDPYNVFHVNEPRDNGIESNKGFIKTKYIKKHYEDFDSLLFGSSRAGFVDIDYLNDKTGGRFYDMASSESLVNEQTNELKVLVKAGFIPKRVWVMVDDISCFVDPALHENMLYRVPYPVGGVFDQAEFYLKYMDLITVFNSVAVINENADKKAAELASGIDNSYDNSTHMSYIDRFYNTGTERLDKVSQFDPLDPASQSAYWCDYYSYRVDAALDDMRELKDVCDKYDIELTVMTNPLYELTYAKDVENGYLKYLEGLAEVTGYYNFSGYSSVTSDYHYYYETSHFTPEVTRMMIDAITSGGDAAVMNVGNSENGNVFGMYISKDNVVEFIAELEEQARDHGVNIYE